MKHWDAFGQQLHVGQTVNCPDGRASQVYALGRSIHGESIVLLTDIYTAEPRLGAVKSPRGSCRAP